MTPSLTFHGRWILASGAVVLLAAPLVGAAPVVDIFAVRTWEPPVPVEVAAPPPEPQAPPLPFVFLGRIDEPGKAPAFLLTEGGAVRVVRVGDRIDGRYLVERYKDGNLVFLYLPMKLRQPLEIGDRP